MQYIYSVSLIWTDFWKLEYGAVRISEDPLYSFEGIEISDTFHLRVLKFQILFVWGHWNFWYFSFEGTEISDTFLRGYWNFRYFSFEGIEISDTFCLRALKFQILLLEGIEISDTFPLRVLKFQILFWLRALKFQILFVWGHWNFRYFS